MVIQQDNYLVSSGARNKAAYFEREVVREAEAFSLQAHPG